MERMTNKRVNGIKTGYWSPNKKMCYARLIAAWQRLPEPYKPEVNSDET